ncbi:UDP-phosphate alpha N-acetylglucosaminyltransferase [uncultured Roseibium sp.]|uniref:UDP-phosphate alpha N-acetylglucosaminyltransferase n=1 Tax=uncultured Roseibium sp. TaxID=1936171 RepID=UPI0026162EB2|nr:UDP-phosphate alpha N-acetylglucosaminyltransferase [uncultured Roseibium sp.]
MLSYNTLDRRELSRALGERDRDRYRLWLNAVYLIAFGTLTFNLMLAFVNSNVFTISESHVILAEMALLGAALLLALSRNAALYVILAIYISYMAFILALRPELDLKAIRDFLIPIVFYFIGRKFRRIEDADRLIWLSAILILAIGFFEFFFLELYTQFIDIFGYYVARGTLEAGSNFVEGSNLFISSTRLEGRNFLNFLGTLRASSVFLEPVTMGNFGAFLCLWALFRSGMRYRVLMFVAAFIAIVMPDARFGMFVSFALFAAAAAGLIIPRILWWPLPLLIVLALALYGGWSSQIIWEDDFTGRLLRASQLLQYVTMEAFFGVQAFGPILADNGFAYSIVQIGGIGLLALWSLFVFAPYNNPKALQFKALAITYISLLMTVSNSFYSIKMAALFWIAAGAADAMGTFRSCTGTNGSQKI